VQQLCSLGALQQQGGSEVLTPLGDHLADMPMDAAVGKALLYGCMLRWGGEWGARG
jgi:HrpA-like RNA helicase